VLRNGDALPAGPLEADVTPVLASLGVAEFPEGANALGIGDDWNGWHDLMIPRGGDLGFPPCDSGATLLSMSNARNFPVVLTRDEDGMFAANCPILPGCFSQGATREEALANIREAIELTLDCRAAEGWELPGSYELTDVPVPMAA